MMKFLTFVILLASMNSYAKIYEVQMLNRNGKDSMTFRPAFLKIKPGDVVKFLPKDPGHTSRSILVPNGEASWSGEVNQEIQISLKSEGVYIYECANHGVMGMIGFIQVGEAKNLPEVESFVKILKSKNILTKNRLDDLMLKVLK